MAERKSPDESVNERAVQVGPESLKAFAHPLRMSMYGELQRLGAATASQLARILGESSGQTSYHLRQLERHGFVEDDPNHTGGRERWWRAVSAEPAKAIVRQVIAERAAALTSWLNNFDPADEDAMLSSSSLSLTNAESRELAKELAEVLERHSKTVRDRRPPEDARPFRVHLDLFPLAGPPPGTA